MVSRVTPRSAFLVLLIRRVGEAVFLFQHDYPRWYRGAVLFLAIATAHYASEVCKPLVASWPQWLNALAYLAILTGLHLLVEPVAARSLRITAEVLGPALSRKASQFAQHETRLLVFLVLLGLFAALCVQPMDFYASPIAIPWLALAWLVTCLLGWGLLRRGRIGAKRGTALRTKQTATAALYEADSISDKHRLRWQLECRPLDPSGLSAITDLATLAFGVEGPNSCLRRRAEYMRTLSQCDPAALVPVHLTVERAARITLANGEEAVGKWRVVQEGIVGYYSVLGLQDDAARRYLQDSSGRLSQFQFGRNSVLDPMQTPVNFVYVQAMVDIGHFRWHSHRAPRVAEFLARQIKNRLDMISRHPNDGEPRPIQVAAEATTHEGRRALTRFFRFLQTRVAPASTGAPVLQSVERHDLFVGSYVAGQPTQTQIDSSWGMERGSAPQSQQQAAG